MGEFKGTPGPWVVKHSESKDAFNVVGTNLGMKYKIARCPYHTVNGLLDHNNREREESEANANLIATAPEMLKILTEIRDAIRYQTGVPPLTMDARITTLLTKALGKEATNA